ncbi:MAG: DUF3105 domain-containing protein [Solirubrobacterales bacterium]
MASRREEKEQLRQERIQREAEEQARKAKQAKARTFAAIGVGVVVVIAIVVGVVVAGGGSKSSKDSKDSAATFVDAPAPANAIAISDGTQAELLAAAKKAGCKFQENPEEGHTHHDPSYDFKFKANPPTSGDHTPTWAQDGAYADVTYSTPYLVHALEHGRVEYLWDPAKVSKQQLGTLKKLYDDDSYHLLLHPTTTEMPYAIAATSWNHSLTCPEMNDDVYPALRLFKLNWIDQGLEQIP